ncbi:NAD(P)/FAD-dependent oxidoreductase [Methanosphaerula palustris]|uniref:Geranylgeranyl reductase n=1 Tax=Methanosphaerula palustris (strain ATCC BAA-1556 / DSM 19958 / E1-9c) TaxID=521011 RepID=B8GFT3_METPE|nr:NAD(P)/FAD-dependent oxidoreductase [Methanosphaerula palustris]ACL17966.1 geranylgeranyl reductase [Methanosphaerula palustris E1-9c]
MNRSTSSRNTTADVVVVGAGPAGVTAAYLLAKDGHQVLLIDKATFPRKKLCAGCLTEKTRDLLSRTFGLTETYMIREGIVAATADHYQISCRREMICKRNTSIPFTFVDRTAYDAKLLAAAEEAGVTVITGCEVTSVDPLIGLVMTRDGRTITGRYLIGADGVNSRVRHAFPITPEDKNRWFQNLASTVEIKVPRSRLAPPFSGIDHPILFFDLPGWKAGYGWAFPGEEEVILGIGGLKQGGERRVAEIFKTCLAAKGLEDMVSHPQGWALPYGNFIRNPTFGVALLVGDAGGFVEPFLGEGIFYAHRTGELAAAAVHRALSEGGDAADHYQQLIRSLICPELKADLRGRNLLFHLVHRLPVPLIRVIITHSDNLLIGLIHGRRSWQWLRPAGNLHQRTEP